MKDNRRAMRALVQARTNRQKPVRRIVGTGHAADAYPENEIASPSSPLYSTHASPQRKRS